jgi:Haem-binding domain
MNKARVKKVLLGLVVFLIGIQFFQPERTNPPAIPSKALSAHVTIPENVRASLMRSCGDCHSDHTVWPWYSHAAPISWMVVDDVNQGRRHMNLQDWDAQPSPKQANDVLAHVCKEIRGKGMPPFTYRITHKNVKLTGQESDAICAWSQSFATKLEQGTRQAP